MDAYAQYRTQAVTTASPAQLVAMLYQGALTAITIAEQQLTGEGPADAELVHRELVRAQQIVTELTLSLDHEQGGQIAANLAALYDFCWDRLVQANLKKDASLLPAVRHTLGDLSLTWAEMMQQQGQELDRDGSEQKPNMNP